jgi:hypothetical protein
MRRIVAKKPAQLRGLAALPGLAALLVVGHAYEDAGPIGASLYVAIMLMSVMYIARPMWICWGPLFAAFVVYAVLVLLHPDASRMDEWVIFTVLGTVPAVGLWIARPRGT